MNQLAVLRPGASIVFYAITLLLSAVLICAAAVRAAAPEGSASADEPGQRYLYIVVDYERSKSGKISGAAVTRVVDSGFSDATDLVPPDFLVRAVEFVADGRLEPGEDAQEAGQNQTWFIYDRDAPVYYSIPPSQEVLDWISERGRYIADYDKATYIASDALMEVAKADFFETMNEEPRGTFVARQVKGKWQVAFGKLAEDASAFSILALATQRRRSDRYKVKFFQNPQIDRGHWRRLATASAVVAASIEPGPTAYNPAIIEDGGKLIVYMLLGRTDPDIYVLGGDFRFTVADETFEIIETVPLHRSVLNMEISGNTAATVSTSVLFDHPVETEVFFVTQWNKRLIPHYLVAGSHFYSVEIDGSINLHGFMYHRDFGVDWSHDIPGRFLSKLKQPSE